MTVFDLVLACGPPPEEPFPGIDSSNYTDTGEFGPWSPYGTSVVYTCFADGSQRVSVCEPDHMNFGPSWTLPEEICPPRKSYMYEYIIYQSVKFQVIDYIEKI